MASLLTDPLYEFSGNGPAPIKTFYYLAITKSQAIWRWWKISLRTVDRNTRPGEIKVSHQEMLDDTRLQGHFNFLELLSDALLLRILSFLELEDVGQLVRTSRRFWKLCQSQEFWENAVRQRCSTLPDEVEALARDIGWRHIFFTNKIQLQLLVNRHRETQKENELSAQNQTPEKSSAAESTHANNDN